LYCRAIIATMLVPTREITLPFASIADAPNNTLDTCFPPRIS